MTYATLEKQIRRLPEDCIDEVASFVEYLIYRQDNESSDTVAKAAPERRSKFNALKGGLVFMADDFDETPECFKEYM